MPTIDPDKTGPYATEHHAAADSPVREFPERSEIGKSGEAWRVKYESLLAACADAGAELGAYDYRVLQWLAGWEPSVVQVIAGLIARAAAGPLEYGAVDPPVLLASWSPAYSTREVAAAEAARTGGQLVCRRAARHASVWEPVL